MEKQVRLPPFDANSPVEKVSNLSGDDSHMPVETQDSVVTRSDAISNQYMKVLFSLCKTCKYRSGLHLECTDFNGTYCVRDGNMQKNTPTPFQ